MLKVCLLLALVNCILTLTFSKAFAYATPSYQITPPQGWHAVEKFGGSDVAFLKAQNPKERQVMMLATLPTAVALDASSSFLKGEMKKMTASHPGLKVVRYGSLPKGPKNAYVKYSFQEAGMIKNEVLVTVPGKNKTHLILLSNDGEDSKGAERELVALVQSLRLK